MIGILEKSDAAAICGISSPSSGNEKQM